MFKEHPRGLYILFWTIVLERFSYYGMKSIMILYMKGGLNLELQQIGMTYGLFNCFTYVCPIIGGILIDKYLGQRKGIFIGIIIMSIVYAIMAIPTIATLYLAMGLAVIGIGLIRPVISTLVGQLYTQGDPRRDSGYTVFYMGINLGAFITPLVCGTLGEKFGWHYGFISATIGTLVGLFVLAKGQQHLVYRQASSQISLPSSRQDNAMINQPLTSIEKDRLRAIGILMLFIMIYAFCAEQAWTSIFYFTDQLVDRRIPLVNWKIPTSWVLLMNPLLVIILAPILSKLWAKKTKQDIALKFAIGLLLTTAAFGLTTFAAVMIDSINLLWIVGFYLLQTAGELYLAPIGLSMVSKLAPPKYASTMMGMWSTAYGVAFFGSGIIFAQYGAIGPQTIFALAMIIAGVAGIFLLFLRRPIINLMHGVV